MRDLMLRLEGLKLRPGAVVGIPPDTEEVQVPDFSVAEIEYHLDQIRMSGFIDEGGVHPGIGIGFRCLTPAGHDFLDSVRNPETWTRTKRAAEKAGGFTLSVLAEIAEGLIKTELQKIGVPL